jgi:hypothetical protein
MFSQFVIPASLTAKYVTTPTRLFFLSVFQKLLFVHLPDPLFPARSATTMLFSPD